MSTIQIKVPNWLDYFFACPLMLFRWLHYGYSYRKIDLGQGDYTILDAQDYYRFGNLKWCVIANRGKLYAACNMKTGPLTTKLVRLHRLILKTDPELLVDHKNGDSLDNRRANLRPATHSQNACNRPKTKSKTSSRFIGLYHDKRRGTWVVRTYADGKKIFLGSFDNEIDAAKAYDVAARKYHGEFARLNFPDQS